MNEKERELYKKKFTMHNISVNEKSKAIRLYVQHSQWYFPFSKYDGKYGAIFAAKKQRDSMPASVIKPKICFSNQSVKSSSGHRGVSVYKDKYGEPVGYLAQWREGKIDNRKTKSKKFHFEKYKDALKSAVRHRKKMEIEHGLAESI